MDYRITLAKPWRYRARKRGVQVLEPGTYNVPEQVARDVAELAVAQGMATKYVPQMPARPATRPETLEPLSDGFAFGKPAVRRRGKGKGPAPENKARHDSAVH